MISKQRAAEIMEQVFEECRKLRGQGQAEYSHADQNALANFERVAERLGIAREAVLMVYMEKHIDGVHSWVKGHKSQRESVKGRLNDIIVYAVLLRCMAEDAEAALPRQVPPVDPNCDQCQDELLKGIHTCEAKRPRGPIRETIERSSLRDWAPPGALTPRGDPTATCDECRQPGLGIHTCDKAPRPVASKSLIEALRPFQSIVGACLKCGASSPVPVCDACVAKENF